MKPRSDPRAASQRRGNPISSSDTGPVIIDLVKQEASAANDHSAPNLLGFAALIDTTFPNKHLLTPLLPL
jgi:hypothetical protein